MTTKQLIARVKQVRQRWNTVASERKRFWNEVTKDIAKRA